MTRRCMERSARAVHLCLEGLRLQQAVLDTGAAAAEAKRLWLAHVRGQLVGDTQRRKP
jgi:hypothetical protein